MKKNLLKKLAAALIILALPAALLVFAFLLPPQYEKTFLGGLSVKEEALSKADKPRIVVIGGSGAAFALRSDLLREEFPDYDVVNYGLYAGLGTTVMLDLALPELKSGDIVIFMPEMSAQTLSDFFSAESMWQAADGQFSVLSRLGAGYRKQLAGSFPSFAAKKAGYFFQGSAPAGDGIYAADSFTPDGDIISEGREMNTMPLYYDPNMPLLFDETLPTEGFLGCLAEFSKACEKKGVQLWFRLCPMNRLALTEEESHKMASFEAALLKKLPCGMLGSAEGALWDPEWFFDTNFHLNASGAVAATRALAQDLKAALGDPSPVSIVVPENPPLPDGSGSQVPGKDEAHFLYREEGAGYVLTGLSESGLMQSSLTVPGSHHGKSVTVIGANAFSGSKVLQELWIPESVRLIEDGAFSGCRALRQIILDQPSPALCSVGTGLLQGCDAVVLVPGESYGTYCTNYFWSVHTGRLLAGGTKDPEGGEQTPSESSGPGDDGSSEVPSESAAPGAYSITYHANGGRLTTNQGDTLVRRMDQSHLRINTLPENGLFIREGFVLVSWNTEADGSGERIGLGSRAERVKGLQLYAQWEAEAPENDFLFEEKDGSVTILGYLGNEARLAVPRLISGLPVRSIASGAFTGLTLDSLVLPSSLTKIEDGAFQDCSIGELTFFDTLKEVGDAAFPGCPISVLHINAARSPVYSGSYYDTFSDKFDWLLSIRDQKKIVLASGSSGRYGYDSEAIRKAFPDYEVANMGVYAYSNALPQLAIIRSLMKEGDVLLSAPEFDAIPWQFCTTNELDAHFWAMMESDYDMAALLDMRDYSRIFDSFAEYQRIRSGMPGKSYSVSPANYDDDGNYYAFATYNQYGDFILPRENNDRDERMHQNIADYTVASFPEGTVESLNRVYESFLESGVSVYFSYTPRNRSSLSEGSTPEARAELEAFLRERISVPVISDLEDSLYSGIYFWKIDSHPSTEGCRLRTEQVIEDLQKVLP